MLYNYLYITSILILRTLPPFFRKYTVQQFLSLFRIQSIQRNVVFQ